VHRAHIAAWSGPDTLATLFERGAGGTTITAELKENAHA
jgi:hypothetical protein